MRKLAIVALCLFAGGGLARAEKPRVFAITGARLVIAPGQIIDGGTLVLRDGLIEAVGKGIAPPSDAWILDGSGKTVTAGFIDACTDLAQRKSEPPSGGGAQGPAPQRDPPAGPVHPISRIHAERKAVDLLVVDAAAFEKHRGMGFTTAVTMPGDGIFRGEAAMIALGGAPVSGAILRASVGQMVAFDYGGFAQGYPSSLMGAIAAIRQALLDAQQHAVWSARYQTDPVGMPRPDYMDAFGPLAEVASGRTPAIFDIKESADVARAIAIAKEFTLNAMIIGSGAESVEPGTVGALKKSGYPVILPLAFPDKPKVDDADEALNVSLPDLEKWDAAPANPKALKDAGVPIALGTCRLSSVSDFPANLRKSLERGLTADAALAALTTSPAKFFGVEKVLGTLEAGKIANVVVFDGAPPDGQGIFAEKSKPAQVFVDGVKFDIERKKSKGNPDAKVDPRGTWSVVITVAGRTLNRAWTIKGAKDNYSGTAETQAGLVDFVSVKLAGDELTVVLPGQGGRPSQEVVVIIKADTFEGGGDTSSGGSLSVKGSRVSGPEGGTL